MSHSIDNEIDSDDTPNEEIIPNFKQAWYEAMTGQTISIDRVWEELENQEDPKERTVPESIAGKSETLGDLINPIVDEQDWEYHIDRKDLFGCLRGQIEISDDFNELLSDFVEYM